MNSISVRTINIQNIVFILKVFITIEDNVKTLCIAYREYNLHYLSYNLSCLVIKMSFTASFYVTVVLFLHAGWLI